MYKRQVGASRLCWTVRVIKGKGTVGSRPAGPSDSWLCVGVIADPDCPPESFSDETCYAWGGQAGQVYMGDGKIDNGRGGWDAWRTDDTAKMTLDVAAGTLSMEHTRGGVVSQHQLDGLDPTKEWRLYVNCCGIGSSVELM